MAVREIEIYGSEVLKRPAAKVKKVSEKIKSIINDMLETVVAKDGVGLAAPQIGESLRIIVIDLRRAKENIKLICINPVITKMKGEVIDVERCLSFPDFEAEIKRAKEIEVEYMNEKERKEKIKAKDLLARVFQHEIDHLNGKLIIDNKSEEEKELYKKKIEKYRLEKSKRN